jgi:ABC-type Fe3+-hydroxamate transport system substrate-binding protein
LTEAIVAFGAASRLVGRTAYCVQPAEQVAVIPTVGGTKTPDLDRIRALRPELVVASAEENVKAHVEALIDAGVPVYVSLIPTVARAIEELEDLASLLNVPADNTTWIRAAAETAVEFDRRNRDRAPIRYFCPIWRRPYMVARPDTYMSDFLRLCGGENVFTDGPAHYYPVELAEAARRSPEVVLLPDEPYPFRERHAAEVHAYADVPAVRSGRVHLIDGQWITWYGPRIAPSLQAVAALLAKT